MTNRVRKLTKNVFKLTALALAFAPAPAFATLGYFAHGFGLKAKGMGGVGIALPQDALAPATNPAGNAWIGTRFDGELEWFRPIREAEIVGSVVVPGLRGKYDASGRKDFLIPGVGYNRMINQDLALGIAVFGNGGMNTTYNKNPFGGFLGGGPKGGVDYMQLFIAPTIAYKLNQNHSIGATLNLVYHKFGAQGLEGFAFPPPFNASVSPGNVTNRGREDATGASLRLGWTGKIAPTVTLGATYQSKTKMGKLGKYSGLFRNGGELDVPENYGIGIAWDATPKLKIAADILQINYAKVASIGTPSDCLLVTGTCQLGASNGPGFGWRNATAYKIGVSYAMSQSLTLRAGYATTKQPIPANQTFFNILFPAVVQDHITLGATLATGATELTVGYMHALKKTVSGAGSMTGFGGGEANLRMYQNSLGVGLGMKF